MTVIVRGDEAEFGRDGAWHLVTGVLNVEIVTERSPLCAETGL